MPDLKELPMTRFATPQLKPRSTADEAARQDFVSGLRSHVLNRMATSLTTHYERDVRPRLAALPADGEDVHKALRGDNYFRFYSAMRVAAQEMVWESVREPIERDRARLNAAAAELVARRPAGGALVLDPGLAVPRYVDAIDIHLMPGNYHGGDDLAAGALYENGLSVFSFGLMGETLDDIGRSVALWLQTAHPAFAPLRILDLGCTVGHQTLPWKDAYPDAEVTGIDVAAPCLRYAHARAEAMGRKVVFRQMDASRLDFPDASFDLVFSSMFLHELPAKTIAAVLAEARRVLAPGGLMLHYELPPNSALAPFDAFYLDWDSHYNQEPWYKGFRDQDLAALCRDAGFASEDYFDAVAPSIGWYGEAAVIDAVTHARETGSARTGRLADGVQWFMFGAWA
jgi:ubiquinone/menaquinone biosynthesis C-methylase UbiE